MIGLTGLFVGLCLAVVTLCLLLAFAGDRIVRLQCEAEDQQDANHAKCIAHIADFTSKRIVALHLRDLAEQYDNVSEMSNLNRIKRGWTVDGPSVPAAWLLQQADLLDPQTIEENA